MKSLGQIPAQLTPEQVIQYCLSDPIKEELEGDPQAGRKKWFVRWTSVLLPDLKIRAEAVEFAAKLLAQRAPRWSYLCYTPYLNRPTPCILSKGTPVAEFLEKKLMPYLNSRGMLLKEGLREEEVLEALRYAAATLGEGSPPGLD